MATKKKNKLVETVTPVASLEEIKPIEEATPIEDVKPVEAAPAAEKSQRKSSPKEDVLARRGHIKSTYEEIVAEMTKPLRRVDIARLADEKLGRPGDGVSWNDGGVALAAFVKEGILVETKVEGRKQTYYKRVG